MTTTTNSSRDFDVQVLTDTIQGEFAGQNAFMNSVLRSQGAVVINDQMPHGSPDFIGNEITIPYFGVVGEFASNAEDNPVTPKPIKTASEKATVVRDSLAFEVSRWARFSGPNDADPYQEFARQVNIAAARKMDAHLIEESATSPLLVDEFTTGASPQLLDWDLLIEGRSRFGDEDNQIVGMVVHSRTLKDLRGLRDSDGRLLLVENMANADVPRFGGVPVIVSDRATNTGSTMTTVVEDGTTPPDVTLSGTPMGAFDLRIKCVLAGNRGTSEVQFSTDGGNTWSGNIVTAASFDLIDPKSDSIVGVNGQTGLTATMEDTAAALNNVWSSKTILATESILVQRGAMAFWYNRNALQLLTDQDILKDNQVAAMHLYSAPHLYRRRAGGSRPGVVRIRHNVSRFNGKP